MDGKATKSVVEFIQENGLSFDGIDRTFRLMRQYNMDSALYQEDMEFLNQQLNEGAGYEIDTDAAVLKKSVDGRRNVFMLSYPETSTQTYFLIRDGKVDLSDPDDVLTWGEIVDVMDYMNANGGKSLDHGKLMGISPKSWRDGKASNAFVHKNLALYLRDNAENLCHIYGDKKAENGYVNETNLRYNTRILKEMLTKDMLDSIKSRGMIPSAVTFTELMEKILEPKKDNPPAKTKVMPVGKVTEIVKTKKDNPPAKTKVMPVGRVIDDIRDYIALGRRIEGEELVLVSFNGIKVNNPGNRYRYTEIEALYSLKYVGKLRNLPEIRPGYKGPPCYCVDEPFLVGGGTMKKQPRTTFIIDSDNFSTRNLRVLS